MGWAHQTYAEFLAAWYLSRLDLTLEQVLDLIVHPEDPDGKLVPQLHEMVAWLANLRPDVFQKVMEREPKVLLQSDVAAADTSSRAALVAEVLKLYDEERDFDGDWFLGARYRKLNHPNIADQLRPFIKDREKGFMVRRMAIQMAGDCKTRELQDDLVDVALDALESIDIRFYAAHAVTRAGDRETKGRLKQLAEGQAGPDPDHELRAIALKALWPEQLSTEELFNLLIEPGANDTGSYGSFLAHDVVENLKIEDLPTALRWAENQRSYHFLNYYSKLLINQLMLLAWENVQTPGVLEAFARVAFSRLRKHEAIVEDHYSGTNFREMFIADDERRRLVLEKLLPMVADPKQAGNILMHTGTPIATHKDVLWLLKRLLEEKSEESQYAWASIIRACWNYGDPDQLDLIYLACQVNQAMLDTFIWDFRPVSFDSPQAKIWREGEEVRRKREEEEAAKEHHEPLEKPPAVRIAQFLKASEDGDPDAWWNLNCWLWVEEDGTANLDESEPNLKILPGWQKADSATRGRILAAAKRYLLEQNVQTSAWINNVDILYRPAQAGYRAMRLLLEDDQAFISGLDDEVWKKWAPIILAYHMPFEISAEEKEYQRRLVEMAYRHAPEEIISTLMVDLYSNNQQRGSVSIPEILEGCWDERLIEALLNKAKEPQTKPLSLYHLLRAIHPHDAEKVKSYAESLLKLPLSSNQEEKQKAVIAASFLIDQLGSASWTLIWLVVRSDAEFGRALIEGIANTLSEQKDKSVRLAEQLADEELADLYIWMVGQYPYKDDPNHKGYHRITSRERATRWRDSLLERLKGRGTPEACAALERIANEFPELKFIKRYLIEAQMFLRRRTWSPPSPEKIINLSNEQQKRLLLREEQRRVGEIFQSLWVLECSLEDDVPYGDTCGQGTAFMLSGVGLVTCQHVLCPHVKAFKADAWGKKYKVEVIAQDTKADLAILRLIDAPEVTELTARWSPPLELKEQVTVIGFPNYSYGQTGTIREGEVVGYSPNNGTNLALIDAPIITGNSGGPVLDNQNRVVGVAAKGVKRIEEAHTTEMHAVRPVSALRPLML
jgi:hypothetical protein